MILKYYLSITFSLIILRMYIYNKGFNKVLFMKKKKKTDFTKYLLLISRSCYSKIFVTPLTS